MVNIFDKILAKEIPTWFVWESDTHVAFLTPFANTPGQTIVIPRQNTGDYIFSLESVEYVALMDAVKIVAKILEKAFDTPRVALVFEGTGVAHVHAKLYPLHGKNAGKTDLWSSHREFYPEYLGYLTTVEGPKMSDEELNQIQQKIVNAQK